MVANFIIGNLKLLRPWRRYELKCAPLLPANYTTYRGREDVKKQRSIPRIEGDTEGLNIWIF